MSRVSIARYWGRKPVGVVENLIVDVDEVVVDPFGGSGVIIGVALERGRRGVYIDLNPYAWLIAHVQFAGAPVDEFRSASELVLRKWLDFGVGEVELPDDWLYYRSGRPFYKRRNFNRVSEFFPSDNLRKLRALLEAIDYVRASPDTKLALYLAFDNALFPSSYMKRRGAGSWGVPSYWAPRLSEPQDAYVAFRNAVQRVSNYLRRVRRRSVCYSLDCDGEVYLLMGNALEYDYDAGWTLITDPPFVDEIQYMELSYFYWVWLRVSDFPKIVGELLGRRVDFDFGAELIINPNRGVGFEDYLARLGLFLEKTSVMRRRVLIFHEESGNRLDAIRRHLHEYWGPYREWRVVIPTRRVGPMGGVEYYIFEAPP